jgi:hypothetical protein
LAREPIREEQAGLAGLGAGKLLAEEEKILVSREQPDQIGLEQVEIQVLEGNALTRMRSQRERVKLAGPPQKSSWGAAAMILKGCRTLR